jgi:hypothetical protein
MTRNRILVWCFLFACLHSLVLPAALGRGLTHPYGSILDRNVFRLREPERPTVDPPPPALASVRLTGITTVLTHKLAFLKVRLPGNPAQPPQELALSLAEGQSERNLEVLSIDEKAGRVELLNFGARTVATFEADSPPQPGSPKASVHPVLHSIPSRSRNP